MNNSVNGRNALKARRHHTNPPTAENVEAGQQSEQDEELRNPGQQTGGTGGVGAAVGLSKNDLSQPVERPDAPTEKSDK